MNWQTLFTYDEPSQTLVVKRAVPLLSVVFTQLTNVSCSAIDIQIVCVMVPTLSPGRGRWRVLPPSMSVEIGSSIRWIGWNESGSGMKDAIGHAGNAMLLPHERFRAVLFRQHAAT